MYFSFPAVRLFLLRDSQSNPKAFVLTLCHHQKIKHFQILPVSNIPPLSQIHILNPANLCKTQRFIQLTEFFFEFKLQCEEDGQMFFSLDDGTTKFTDLIQLVEFYQLNRGVLPCKLKHPCTMVALWSRTISAANVPLVLWESDRWTWFNDVQVTGCLPTSSLQIFLYDFQRNYTHHQGCYKASKMMLRKILDGSKPWATDW